MSTPKICHAVGLDAGSAWTRCVICLLESNCMRFLGCASVPSQGWVKGLIADQTAVSECMLAALREAEADAQVSVESAGGGSRRPDGARRQLPRRAGSRASRGSRAARRQPRGGPRPRVQLPEDRMLLQLFPQDFVVDGHPGHRDPRKMMASQLEINVHLLIGSVQEHHSLVGAVNHAHLTVEETVFEAFASWYAAVVEEERREGLAVVDIGAQSTELVVYFGDAMLLASVVPVCGDHFTRDLAQGLSLSFDDAERVKLDYGCAVARERAGERPGGVAHAGRPRAAAMASAVHQRDPGGARGRAVPVCARRTGSREHGARAGGRRVS